MYSGEKRTHFVLENDMQKYYIQSRYTILTNTYQILKFRSSSTKANVSSINVKLREGATI